jgi:hypothetical protein
MQLNARTWLLAVARGFGTVDGVPMERAVLARLRAECERRLRSERFRRAIDRPPAAATALLAALARVNGDLHARSAGHDDYITAAASMTAVLVVRGHAYVIHAGSTAAYLAHGGDVVALSDDDTFDDAALPLIRRAFGTTAALDVAVSNVELDPGDVIVLVGRRVPGEVDRRALIAHVESTNLAEHVLVARFEADDALDGASTSVPARDVRPYVRAAVGVAALVAFTLLAVYAH